MSSGPSQNFLILCIFLLQALIALWSSPHDPRHMKVKCFTMAFYFIFLYQKMIRRVHDFPLIFSFLVEPGFFCLFFYSKSLSFLIYTLLTFLLYGFTVYLLQVYQMPNTTGIYLVGYKEIKIKELDRKIAVFYPTDQKTNDINWLTDPDYLETLLDAAFHHNFSKIIKNILQFTLGFLGTIPLGVNKDARLAEDINSLNIMIFSHGLGGNRHSNSIYLKELASNGFVIFSLDHSEKIIILPQHQWGDVSKFAPMIKEIRGEQLEIRYQAVIKLLDFIYDEERVEKAIGKKIKVNYDKIMISGHSFGGVTAIYTSLRDDRITGGVVCFDPYLFPMKDEYLTKQLRIPLIVICTESFDRSIRYAENHERIEKIFMNSSQKNKNLNFICKGSDHLHQCDMVFFFPVFMKTVGFINRNSDIIAIMEGNMKLMHWFAEEIIMKDGDKENIRGKIAERKFNGIRGNELFEEVSL